jgi:hypothetical protein
MKRIVSPAAVVLTGVLRFQYSRGMNSYFRLHDSAGRSA